MERKIFISSTEQRSGKSLITVGLINAFQGIIPNVGYMKPIGQRYESGGGVDEDAALIKAIFNLEDDLHDINPSSINDAQDNRDVLFEKVFNAYKRISSGKDAVVIEGTDYTSTISALEFDINAELAKNMAAPVLLVAKGNKKSLEEIAQTIIECTESFREMGCDFLGSVVNRFSSENYSDDAYELSEMLSSKGITLFGAIPQDPLLAGPRLKEVAEKLNAEILFKGDDLSKVVTDVKVLAMTPENALQYISDKDGYLLITPGDRIEHLFTVLSAQKSTYYPQYAGMILTGGLIPGKNVRKLMAGITDADLTILSVKGDTYSTALRVGQITGEIDAGDREKIELAYRLVERYVDIDKLHVHLGEVKTETTTPRMFQYRIIEMAKATKKNIVLPEGTERRIIQATAEVLRREICDVTLLGEEQQIAELSRGLGVDIGRARIIDPVKAEESVLEDYAETYYELRKHKGVTREMARDTVIDPIHFATLMVYKNQADGFVSGSTHSTATTLAPVLRIIRAKPGVSLASSVFFMCMPDEVLVYGDCALVENPNAEQLADIAITSAGTAKAFGIEPYVAMLSYSTGRSGKGETVDKVREATQIVKKKRPDIPIDGPIQYDAAISEEVARVKIRDSSVAGKATVYIFPNLDAGNTAYKAVQRAANVPAIGPVLQGLNKPANDLSRGATVTDIIYTIAVTAIQAQSNP
jgi:phosphate acetyltransferase